MNAKAAYIESVQQEALGLIQMRRIIRAEVARQLTHHKEHDHESIHGQQIHKT